MAILPMCVICSYIKYVLVLNEEQRCKQTSGKCIGLFKAEHQWLSLPAITHSMGTYSWSEKWPQRANIEEMKEGKGSWVTVRSVTLVFRG